MYEEAENLRKPRTLKRSISQCLLPSSKTSCEGQDDQPCGQEKKAAYEPQEKGKVSMAVREDIPVLLPRATFQYGSADDTDEDSEPSPLIFEWHDSPKAANQRFYASVMESAAFVSLSPHHVLFPSAPVSASTVSVGSDELMYSPMASRLLSMPYNTVDAVEEFSAQNVLMLVLNYLDEVAHYWARAVVMTFDQLAQMVQSLPSAFRYIQDVVHHRLGVAGHLVDSFVENLLDFISDEDIREATIDELMNFLQATLGHVHVWMRPGNIFQHLSDFFSVVLQQFKKHLMKTWLATRKIQAPCEFGKKSPTLFLCMECHREHH